jgi:hypothetical protein
MTELRDLARQFAELAREARDEAKETRATARAAERRVDQHLVHASGWRPTLPMVPLLPPGWVDDRRR